MKDSDKQMVRWLTSVVILAGIASGSGGVFQPDMTKNAAAALEQGDILLEKLGFNKEDSDDRQTA